MKNVNSFLFLLFLVCWSFVSFSQSSSEKLKQEQARLEKNISNTKSLLAKTKSNTEASFNELRLINNQIKFREDLMRNYDNQIRAAELKIQEKQGQTVELSARIEALKKQYKSLLLYAYKHRNKYGKMMYVFSAESYYEAIKRAKYLEKIQDILKKQFLIIEQNKKLIASEIAEIEKEKAYKSSMIAQKKEERAQIAVDQVKKEALYLSFKQQEAELLAKLRKEEIEKENLKAKINAAIRAEIADAEAKRKKAESAAKSKAVEKGTAVPEAKVELAETKEMTLMGKNFEGNKGRLPWPVEKGTITEGFGKNPHPTLSGVFTNNNGVDISAPKNAQIRAVFEGEVTSILNIPGAGKVVILKHGNYRTVYSNLQNVYVEKGSKVTTKQVIGSLVTKDGQSVSVAHFEIHQVVGSTVNSLNPKLWIVN